MANSPYPRGSEWRRWDLHVHTPASALNSEFGKWDDYITALEKTGAGVSVIGITDYCSIDGYKSVLEYKKKGRLSSFDLILPNIEFRVTPELATGKAINIHLLISPEDPKHVQMIERALGKLTFSYKDNPYACTTDELTALGYAIDPSIKSDVVAFKAGVNAFKPDFKELRKWYEESDWLQKNSLIVIANAKDGASGLSKDSGFSAVRDELYRLSHLIFSGNPKDREYFLGKGTDSIEKLLDEKGSLKPCIHGSDAHGDSKLFLPDKDRFCWIKADPTFEGLRQLLHEPEDRVYIGPTPSVAADRSQIIERVEIKGGNAWFENKTIPLNSGLVAIIGEKGSGKTALADLISFACDAWDGEDSSTSFMWKARNYLDGVEVVIHWADGSTSAGNLAEDPPGEGAQVRYLSQDFVEQLCSQDFKGDKLIAEVEDVVFTHIDEADRLDASSFQELRRLKTSHLESRKSEIRAKISKLNSEIVRAEDEIADKPKKRTLIKQLDEAIAAIDAQLPELQKSVDQEVAKKLGEEKEKLREKTTALAGLNKRKSLAGSAKNLARNYFDSIEEQFQELEETLTELGLSAKDIAAFKPAIAGAPLTILDKLEKALEKDAQLLRGDVNAPKSKGETIADIQKRIGGLEKSVASDAKVRDRLLELQKQRQKADADRTRLKQEIEKIDGAVTKSLGTKREDRWKTYLSYFDVLANEKQELEELYEPLSKVIADDPSGGKAGFDLNVRQIADTSDWLEAGVSLLDQRRKGATIGSRDFAKQTEKGLGTAWRNGDKAAIRKELEGVLKGLGDESPDLDKLLVSHATRVKLYDWVFSPEHVGLEYGLTYQGTDLDALSPGSRGIVLLVLYLAMDQNDRRPLIIDQPEGNLDNSSIYESLVPFLRRAKKSRQIILVTHNPNLVVTTDADQVIVASSHKKPGEEHAQISYVSGSLEHADGAGATRDHAVRLLEGGKRPFKIREGRWRISDLLASLR